MIEIYKISWHEVMQMAKLLAKKLQDKRIWGIPRGGQLVATIMAYHGCKLVEFATRAEVIIDDIADTGQVLHKRLQHTQCLSETATLVVRLGCDPSLMPNHYVVLLCADAYVLFPWEDEKEAFEYMRRKENEVEPAQQ